MARETSSGTTVDSHPLFFGLHPFMAFFAIVDVDPDSLRFSLLYNRLTGSPPVILKIAHVCIIVLFSRRLVNTGTRFN